MKTALLCVALTLAAASAAAQVDIPTGAYMREKTIRLDTLASDSADVLTLEARETVIAVYFAVDSTVTGTDGDSVKVGTAGDATTGSARFLGIAYADIEQGRAAVAYRPSTDAGNTVWIATEPRRVRMYSRASGGQVRVIVETRKL